MNRIVENRGTVSSVRVTKDQQSGGSFSLWPRWLLGVVVMLTAGAWMASAGAADSAENLALGKTVFFAPTPNYELTAKGDSDSRDLTDGKLSSRKDSRLWFDSQCVGYSYPGLVQLAVDLGAVSPIGEVAVRFQGGSPSAGVAVPGWVDLLVSDDGTRFYKIASYSKWRPGDKERFGIPRDEGQAWVHPFRFRDLKTRGRWVGLSFYGTGLTVSDELWVIKGSHDPAECRFDESARSDFTIKRPRAYFHKPTVFISTNIATPNPIGLIAVTEKRGERAEVQMDLPPGVRLLAGRIGGVNAADMKSGTVRDGDGEFTRVTFAPNLSRAEKDWGRVYFGCDWDNGRRGFLRYRLRQGDYESPWMKQPIEAIHIPPAPQPTRLVTGLGWWSLSGTLGWPDALNAFRHLGLNTLPVFARYPETKTSQSLTFVEKARSQNFKIMNIDSPLHNMLGGSKPAAEVYCQFGEGKRADRLCPSYRGPLYRAEIERVARQTATVKADFLSCDIELWSWRGPQDAPKCTRCKEDFAKSGKKDWNEWYLAKGQEIWTDLSNAVRKAMGQSAGADGRPPRGIEIGGYDFRPGGNYQNIWPFDRLYPAHMQNSQVSTYTPLEPYHLGLIGDEARADREKLPRSDVLPWITPGDAGTFPGEMFRWAVLECFANGSRGIHFWSSRVWDTETLAAFAEAIRIVAPVENVIVDGEVLKGVSATPPIRISGMRKGDQMLLLVADYFSTAPKSVTVRLPVKSAGRVTDLQSGREVGRIQPPDSSFVVQFDGSRAKVLHIHP